MVVLFFIFSGISLLINLSYRPFAVFLKGF